MPYGQRRKKMSNNKKEASEVDWDFEKAAYEDDVEVFVEAFAICDALTTENPNVDIDGETAFRVAEKIVRENRKQERELVSV